MYIRSKQKRVARADEGAQRNGSKYASTPPSAATTASQEQGMSARGDEQEVVQKNRASKTSFCRKEGVMGKEASSTGTVHP